jgi:hypothetical protein
MWEVLWENQIRQKTENIICARQIGEILFFDLLEFLADYKNLNSQNNIIKRIIG